MSHKKWIFEMLLRGLFFDYLYTFCIHWKGNWGTFWYFIKSEWVHERLFGDLVAQSCTMFFDQKSYKSWIMKIQNFSNLKTRGFSEKARISAFRRKKVCSIWSMGLVVMGQNVEALWWIPIFVIKEEKGLMFITFDFDNIF